MVTRSPSARRQRSGVGEDFLSWVEYLLAGLLLTAGLGLRVLAILHSAFDSDEPQHLHVVWSWTQGLIQYRDVFDNHTPLFHMLMAPVAAVVGERPDILIVMRFAMLPLFGVVLWLSACIARDLFGRRGALWSVVLLTVVPLFFFRTLQFRPLDLWLVWWLASILLLIRGAVSSSRRGVVVGLLLGAAIATSLKTLLMMVALLFAAALLVLVRPDLGAARARDGSLLRWSGAVLAGLCVVPGLLVALFVSLHAGRAMLYGTVLHNLVPGLGSWRDPMQMLLLPAGLGAVTLLAWGLVRRGRGAAADARVLYVLLLAGAYGSLLAVWPLVSGQTVDAVVPLVVVLLVGLLSTPASRRVQAVSRAAAVPRQPVQIAAATEGAVEDTCSGPRARGRGDLLVAQTLRTDCSTPAAQDGIGSGKEPTGDPSTAAAAAGARRWPRGQVASMAMVVLLVVGSMAAVAARRPFWENHTRGERDFIADVLRLTGPSDYVFDLKGENVFRRRPFYYALERITRVRMWRGLIVDDIPARCIATHTMVVTPSDYRLPRRVRAFFHANYLPVGHVRVAGQVLSAAPIPANGVIDFTIVLAGRYALMSPDRPVTGSLDGTTYSEARFLSAGHHRLVTAAAHAWIVLEWARAARLGFRPQIER